MPELNFFSDKVSKESKLFTFLVVFMALGNVYQLPGVSQLGVGEIMLMCSFPFFLKGKKFALFDRYSIGFIFYFFYLTLVSLVALNYFDGSLSKLVSIARVAFYWVLIFFFGRNLFSLVYFRKNAYIFALSLSLFIIIQFFVFTFTKFYIPGLIPNAPLNQGNVVGIETMQHYLDMASYMGFIRPSGFLLEPAHCVQYLFICLLFFINDKSMDEKKKLYFIILVSIAMLTAQSSTGLILLLFSWICFMFVEKNYIKTKIFFIMLVIGGFVYMLANGGIFDFWALDRLLDVASGTQIDTSSNFRLNNGFNLFEKFPFVFKIFGTGMGMFELISYDFEFGNAINYMNSFSFTLFSAGYIGLFIWLISLAYLFYNTYTLGKCVVLGFFVMSLGCSIFCQPQMVWMFLLFFADIRKENDRYSCIKL